MYLDASALVRLAILEPGADELAALVNTASEIVTSSVALVEVRRALARSEPDYDPEIITGRCTVIDLDPGIIRQAGLLAPPTLRSLDAIHVASALAIAKDLDAFVTCDQRQASAAVAAGLPVRDPA
ncbi:MAG: type II toxin-antitoxin system VapC family toxin [Chloroflexi bacterium]|nr:type II toxin-antitoxin system VapC family toxin [Chloroflexota bacterium]